MHGLRVWLRRLHTGRGRLPLETQVIPVRTQRATLSKPSKSRFSPERARLECFTEEKTRFQIPVQSFYQRPLSLASSRGSLHVLTESPIGVHTFWNMTGGDVSPMRSFMNLEDILPYQSTSPRLTSTGEKLVLYLPSSNLMVLFSPEGGDCTVLGLPKLPAEGKKQGGRERGGMFQSVLSSLQNTKPRQPQLLDSLARQGVLVIDGGGSLMDVLHLSEDEPVVHRVHLPQRLRSLEPCSEGVWLASVGNDNPAFCWIRKVAGDRAEYEMIPIHKRKIGIEEALGSLDTLNPVPGFAEAVLQALEKVDSRESVVVPGGSKYPLLTHADAVLQKSVAAQAIEQKETSLWTFPRLEPLGEDPDDVWHVKMTRYLPRSDQTVSIFENEKGEARIQIAHEAKRKLKVIEPIRLQGIDEEGDEENKKKNKKQLVWADVVEMENGDMATLQRSGPHAVIRTYQVDSESLESELEQWTQMLGLSRTAEGGYVDPSSSLLDLEVQGGAGGLSANPPPIDTPKHGKEDPNNAPHVGGNTWAGGTGGSNTAGLGGRGGPYRLDKGHAVHQVSEAAKREVDEETNRAARELNRKAFAERLKEIEMTEDEHGRYMSFLSRVEQEIGQLRVVLDSLESRKQERTWLKNQAFGHLDDSKLVDGVTGERLIYKRRGLKDPSPFMNSEKKKRIRIVVDCSGSMYRFNGQDGRLERECELVVMLLEALDGFESRFEYSIVGHSGESEEIVLVDYNAPPRTRKERLQVCLHMIAHSQFCFSGDMTLEATESAVENVAQEDCDEGFVFVVSDANLRRYGIPPSELGRRLVANPDVNAYAIFIASFGEEAQRIKRELPPGKGFVVLDTAELPNLFREIFVTNVLHD